MSMSLPADAIAAETAHATKPKKKPPKKKKRLNRKKREIVKLDMTESKTIKKVLAFSVQEVGDVLLSFQF